MTAGLELETAPVPVQVPVTDETCQCQCDHGTLLAVPLVKDEENLDCESKHLAWPHVPLPVMAMSEPDQALAMAAQPTLTMFAHAQALTMSVQAQALVVSAQTWTWTDSFPLMPMLILTFLELELVVPLLHYALVQVVLEPEEVLS